MLIKLSLLAVIVLAISYGVYNYGTGVLGGSVGVEKNTNEKRIAHVSKEINAEGETSIYVIYSQELEDIKETMATSGKSHQEITRINKDGSQTSTMYDGYGNKTEIRVFKDHSRLRMVIVRTPHTGDKQLFVYGHNSKVKRAPQSMLNKMLTSSADEIANLANIYETRADREREKAKLAKKENEKLRPIPSDEIPVNLNPLRETVGNENKKEEVNNEDSEDSGRDNQVLN